MNVHVRDGLSSLYGYRCWRYFQNDKLRSSVHLSFYGMATKKDQMDKDYIIFKENGLFGAKNQNGEVIIPPQYMEMQPFSCGLSLVRNHQYQYAYIDITNRQVIPFGKYSWCDPQFVCGYARVVCYNITKGKNEWGIIDTEGNIIVPIKYDKIWVLNESYFHSVKAFLDDKEVLINLYAIPKCVIFDDLKYIATYTIEEFKALFNCTRIDVKVNPKTEELFFSYGSHIGCVALKSLPISPVISVVINSAGSLFLLLHEKEDTGKTNFEKSIYKRHREKSSKQLSNTTFWEYEEENTIDSDSWSDPYGDERAYYDGWSREDAESGLADAYE